MTFEEFPMKSSEQILLIRMEFLGFRFHGWQTQPGQLTLESMLKKTLKFVLPEHRIKVLGAGRTDAKVSATDFAVQCSLQPACPMEIPELRRTLNDNLPPDIRLTRIKQVSGDFNAISDVVSKQYSYYFCFGEKPHPFSASLLGYFSGLLDLEVMKEAAALLEGTHDFSAFIAGSGEKSTKTRTITGSRILVNNTLQASFFPETTFEYRVMGKGFGRYQVRLMMAALVAIGRGEASLQDLKASLKTGAVWPVGAIAPASGLQLRRTDYAFRD